MPDINGTLGGEFKLADRLTELLFAKSEEHDLDAQEVMFHLFAFVVSNLLEDGWTEEELIEEVKDSNKYHLEMMRKEMH
jgi:hypothetical protein